VSAGPDVDPAGFELRIGREGFTDLGHGTEQGLRGMAPAPDRPKQAADALMAAGAEHFAGQKPGGDSEGESAECPGEASYDAATASRHFHRVKFNRSKQPSETSVLMRYTLLRVVLFGLLVLVGLGLFLRLAPRTAPPVVPKEEAR